MINKYLMMMLILLAFISCTQGENKMDEQSAIAYGTLKFEKFEKNAKINLNEAWNLSIDFIKQKSPEKNEHHIEKMCLFFIMDEHYIFSSYETDKQYRVYPFSGIWVNSNTGKAFEKIIGGPQSLQGLKFFRK